MPTNDYSTENSIKVITEVAKLLEVNKFSLAGNSMGGGIAWRYALKHPNKIESLILLASSGIYTEEQRKQIQKK